MSVIVVVIVIVVIVIVILVVVVIVVIVCVGGWLIYDRYTSFQYNQKRRQIFMQSLAGDPDAEPRWIAKESLKTTVATTVNSNKHTITINKQSHKQKYSQQAITANKQSQQTNNGITTTSKQ